MVYAVEFFFEEAFEQYIKGIWKSLNDENIASDIFEISGARPHITTAVYDDIPQLEAYCRRFDSYCETVNELQLKFDVLATFPTTGTLLINPTVTESLIELHKQYHEKFDDLLEQASGYYYPGNWDPHCTLAINLNPVQMIEAMQHCYKDFIPQKSKIFELGLVKLDFDSNRKCISSTTLISRPIRPYT